MHGLRGITRQVLVLAVPVLLLAACQSKGGGSTAVVVPATVATLAGLTNATPLTATRSGGFESATFNNTLTTFSNDIAVSNAFLTYYSNGSIALSAPNIPVNGTNDTVTFSLFNAATSPLAPPGSTIATGTSAANVIVQLNRFGASQGLQYSEYGSWVSPACGACTATNTGYFAIGNATPTAQIPTTGSLTYTGNAQGLATIGTAGSTSIAAFSGLTSLTANFATNAVTGSISSVRTSALNGTTLTGTMNDILLTGGTISGNSILNGVATAGVNAGTGINITGVKGTFGGGFYGPSAAEIAGTFNLNTPATIQVIGSFGTHR